MGDRNQEFEWQHAKGETATKPLISRMHHFGAGGDHAR